jgi:hypothetical protein
MPSQTHAGDGEVELKAGHPPAVKVGNMRVVQRTHSTSSDKNDDEATSGGDSSSAATVPSACSFAPKQVVNKSTGGVPDNLANQNIPEAVKHIHEKPQATHDIRNHSSKPNIIQQPKK